MSIHYITEWDIIIRLILGFFAGAILGFERSSRHQFAGLRTHILISLGATLLTLVSIWIPQNLSNMQTGDPGRIAAQVVSGIGFLGAGAIIRLGNSIRGLTTAASLWFVAAAGLTVGAGMFLAAGISVAIGLFTLFFLGKFERKIFPSERLKILEIFYKDHNPDTDKAMDAIKSYKMHIQSVNIEQGSKGKGTRLRLLVGIPSNIDIAFIAHVLKSLDSVGKVIIKENY